MNKEMVNHPSHYNVEGKKECIVEMEEKFGVYETIVFCTLNAYKYLYRAGYKIDKEEDVKKAKWYYKYAINLLPKIKDYDVKVKSREMLYEIYPKVYGDVE